MPWLSIITACYLLSAALLLTPCIAPPSQIDNIEANLIDALLGQYPSAGLARPIADFNKPFLTVSISMVLHDFDDLDDITGLLSFSGQVAAQWSDQNLKWNSTEYQDIDRIQLRAASIWLPPIIQYNYAPDCLTPLFSSGGTTSLSTVWVRNTGLVTAVHSGELTTKCDIDLSMFPFDSQSCSFLYTTYAYTDDQLQFTSSPIGFIDATPDPSGVWSLRSYSCNPKSVSSVQTNSDKVYSGVECNFIMKRRSTWYLVNFFAPSILMACLQLSSFFMPLGVDRTSFCMTVVLAFAVFQTVTATLLPITSSSIPMVTYIIMQMVVGTVATLHSIYVFYLYDTGSRRGKAIPKCMRWMLWLYGVHKDDDEIKIEKDSLEDLIKTALDKGVVRALPRRADFIAAIPDERASSIVTDKETASQVKQKFYRDMSKAVRLMARQQLRRMKDDSLEEQWHCVASFLDTLVGILCLITTAVSTGLFFCPQCLLLG